MDIRIALWQFVVGHPDILQNDRFAGIEVLDGLACFRAVRLRDVLDRLADVFFENVCVLFEREKGITSRTALVGENSDAMVVFE